MYKVGIIDDEESACAELERMVSDYGKEKGVKFSVSGFIGADDTSLDNIVANDIVFLDIEMPGMNGMELAKKIRGSGSDVILIFCTNLQQFALNGYEVDALGFIVKPMSRHSFDFFMDKAIKKLSRKEKVRGGGNIHIKTVGSHRCVGVNDIGFVEVRRHKLFYHIYGGGAPSEVIQTRGSMQEAENELAPFGFVRCSIGYLVNLGYVSAIKGNEIYLPETVLFVSRNYKKRFTEAFMRSIATGEADNK